MASLSLSDLYSQFYQEFVNEPDFFISFHNKNSILFNNYRSFANADEVKQFMEMTCYYIGALYRKDRYHDTISEADKYLIFIDSGIAEYNAIELKDDWYYNFIYFKAMAYYCLDEFKTALKLFNQLVTYDPKNDNYAKWLKYSRYRTKQWMINSVWILCGLLIIFDLFFSSYVKTGIIRTAIPIVALTAFAINSFAEYITKRNFKKIDK